MTKILNMHTKITHLDAPSQAAATLRGIFPGGLFPGLK